MTWTNEKAQRRAELIGQHMDGTISRKDTKELEKLEEEMLAHRRQQAPLPLSELRRLRRGLLTKEEEEGEP